MIIILFAMLTGCSTIPVTLGTQAIDSMLSDGSLDPVKTDTTAQAAQKEKIKKTLIQARTDIVRESSERVAAENQEKKDAKWAGIGKGLTAAGIALGVLLIAGIALKIAGKLPFV
jgi:ElaB/YqjD/DUF883 family membrane-anchored ribosome-binding protein